MKRRTPKRVYLAGPRLALLVREAEANHRSPTGELEVLFDEAHRARHAPQAEKEVAYDSR